MSLFPTSDGEGLTMSPLSTSARTPSPSFTVEPSTRASRMPPVLEPLSFAKLPLSPQGSRSVSVSTDCESVVSDYGGVGVGGNLSRSPSLLTSLIQSQARRSARTTPATTPGVSPTTAPLVLPGSSGCSRPILRRCSSGAFTSDDGSRPHLATLPEQDAEPTLRSRRSCLKFAVTPRPLQLQSGPARSTSENSSRRPSAGSSRLTSPRAATPALLEDEDEDEADVAEPAFDSDDAGYQEDSEDGFTSDEDEAPTLIPKPGQWPPAWMISKNPAPAPILWTAARRAATDRGLVPEPSTDDAEEMPPRRARVRIRDEEKSARKCTRHRSPPPVNRLPEAPELERAPPAARSPSAADLCRRRSGAPSTPLARSPAPAGIVARGWRSDDCARRAPRGVSFLPHRTTSQPVRATCHVKFDVEHVPQLRRKCSMLVRRDSAPAAGRVDEVHVLAAPSENRCPLAELRASLRR